MNNHKYTITSDRDYQKMVDSIILDADNAIREAADTAKHEIIVQLKQEILTLLRKEIDEELESRILYELKNIRQLLEEMK